MKKIIVTESQMRRLVKSLSEGLVDLCDKESGINEYPGSITTVNSTKENNNGDLDYAKPTVGDEMTNVLTTQRGIRGYNCRWR